MIIQILISDGKDGGCPICASVKKKVFQAKAMLEIRGYNIEIQVFNMDSPGNKGEEAVDFAINKGLSLVPSTVIGTQIFEMDNITVDEVVKAVLKQSKAV